MRRLAIAIAWGAIPMALAQQPAPIVVFKKARTGSTWLADMLEKDERVAFFRHEAQGCFSDDAERTPRCAPRLARHGGFPRAAAGHAPSPRALGGSGETCRAHRSSARTAAEVSRPIPSCIAL